ncbi:SAM-dependent methyltransferase [Mycobacterium sp. E3247]|uniref:class I SAM-dependent methyltransferase n=1 Tax=Mycobacterium sp. E3247 TaxID=1856864 RepID=UPI0007FFC85F|nr:SAM-dependent methyltransferase [Mycobacterium sp. E3247]OBH15088.1 hypothetical protein A9X04_13390 [Mycobacterium sp. E3247]
MSKPAEVEKVSDTARWVAAVRAEETRRPDALFADPFSELLAGDRGAEIANGFPYLARVLTASGIIARTAIIDKMITDVVGRDCDRVVNLGCGMDTRPFRLQLPQDLEWVEVDLPDIIDEKTRQLETVHPNCELSRVSADLSDPQVRTHLLEETLQGSHKALVMTEGVLAYLTTDQVKELSSLLSAGPVAWWITDVYSRTAMRTLRLVMRGRLDKAGLGFVAPASGFRMFHEHGGWLLDEAASEMEMAARWGRMPAYLRALTGLANNHDFQNSGRGNWVAIARLTKVASFSK